MTPGSTKPRPPALARLVLALLYRGRDAETVVGDADEGFARRVERWGEVRARSWYRRQVAGSIWALAGRRRRARVATVRNPSSGGAGLYRQNIRHAVRSLRRSPGFTGVASLTLALGIGAAAAVFTVVDAVLLEPLPFDEPDELIGIWHEALGLDIELAQSATALHFTYRDHGRVLDDVGHWDRRDVAVTGVGEPEQVAAVRMTASLLAVLRVEALVGRRFTEADDLPGAPATALLSESYWRERFVADPDAVGRVIEVDGRPREIVGVLPGWFALPGSDARLYVPLQLDRAATVLGDFTYSGMGRLTSGATVEDASADLERMLPLAPEFFPGAMTPANLAASGLRPVVHPLKDDYVGDVDDVLWVIFGSVAILLLIACANVANLFLVRSEARRREMAVRTAIGAGRGRITGHFLAESLLLGVSGGALGLALAVLGVRVLVGLESTQLPRVAEIAADGSVLAFTAAVAVIVSVLCGLLAAGTHAGGDVARTLRAGPGQSRGSELGGWTRSALVVSQMALALVLLAGSGLMLRSFLAMTRVEPGFTDPDQVLTMRVAIPSTEVPNAEETALAFEEIWRRLGEIPGVAAVGASSALTMDGFERWGFIWTEDRPISLEVAPPTRRFKSISEGYFEAMGNPVLAGRPILWRDIHERARVAVVTRNFAEEYWGSPEAAVGKRISTGDPANPVWQEVVGVVGDVHDDGVQEPAPTVVFWPYVSELDGRTIVVRTLSFAVRAADGRGALGLVDEVEEAVWAVDADLPVARLRTLDAILAESMARTSLTTTMLLVAGVVSLLLGLVGLYGVVSYSASRRTREIGIRIALGAERTRVSLMMLSQAARLVTLGAVLGLAAAMTLTRLMSSLLYGVEATDPLTYAAVATLLVGTALLACYVPARRAASTDPVVAIRSE